MCIKTGEWKRAWRVNAANRKSCSIAGLTEAAAEVDVSRGVNKMTHFNERNEITTEKQLTKGCLQINRTVRSACNSTDLTVVLLYNKCMYSYMKLPSGGGGRGAK